jgi:hypothetical protein
MAADGVRVDVILSTQTFEHLQTPRRLLRDCLRVLEPHGYVLIEVPYDLMQMERILGKKDTVGLGHCEHLNFYTPASLRQLARVAGLRTVRSAAGVQIHKYGGLIPSVTVLGTPGTGQMMNRFTLEAIVAEVTRDKPRVRLLQRLYQLNGFARRLGRW